MSEERGAVDERSLLYGLEGEQHVDHSMSNADAVSLFNTSLSKALEKQQSAIIETLSEKLGKSTSSTNSAVGGSDCTPYESKHEGHKIQFNFNQERFGKLTEIEDAVRSSDVAKVFEIIAEQKVVLTQRNKILKIADRHGWDTVNEYLDDPLADNNDDAIKLRYAVNRATRKRNYRYRPYERRRAGMFSPSAFFRGFGRAVGAPGSATGFSSQAKSSCQVLVRSPGIETATTADNRGISSETVRLPEPRPSQPLHQQLSQQAVANEVEYLEKMSGDVDDLCEYGQNIEFTKSNLFANEFILNTLQFGYIIPFENVPPCAYLKNNRSSLVHSEFVKSAILELLQAKCVTEVEMPYIVNPLTVSVNSSGKKRLVLDLRHVNKFVIKQNFKGQV